MADTDASQGSQTVDVAAVDGAIEDSAVFVERQTVTLPLITESLQVETLHVDRGGYRISKRVEARDVLVDELLRHETVDIERRPLNRVLEDGLVPEVRYEGDTMIVPVVKEIVVTEKRLVLFEEIRITRTSSMQRNSQTVALREEHVVIERLGAEKPVIRSS